MNNPDMSKKPSFPLAAKIINGGVAGIIGVSSVFPLDLAKTRLQNQRIGKEVYTSMVDCLKKVMKSEGFFGMYRGSAVNLLLITPEKAIKLTGNDLFRHMLTKEGPNGDKHLSLPRQILAGGGAGLCQIVVTTPMELLKIQCQDAGRTAVTTSVNSSGPAGAAAITQPQKPSAMRVAIDLVKTNGIAGLYKGTAATMLRDVSFSLVYFPLFAYLSSLGNKTKSGDGNSVFWVNFMAGCTAAGASAVIVNPADVVKTRLQLINTGAHEQKYNGVRQAFVEIYKNEGPKAFLKGSGCRIMYIAPLFGIAQTVYYLGIGEKVLEHL